MPTRQISETQEDFSAGEMRDLAPALIPSNGTIKIVNGLPLLSDGSIYRRGGTTWVTNVATGTSNRWIWSGAFVPGGRVVWIAFGSGLYVLSSDGATPINISGSGFTNVAYPRQSAYLRGLLFIGATDTAHVYGGTYKTANYSTGSVTVTQGSATVTGSGTSWSANVDAGMIFNLTAGHVERYVVKTVDSNTQITLNTPFLGSSGGGLGYDLQKTAELNAFDLPDGLTGERGFEVIHNRLITRGAIEKNKLFFSEIGNPFDWTNAQGTLNFHSLPQGEEVIGFNAVGPNLIVWSTKGAWMLSGLAHNIVDAAGNPQHQMNRLSTDLIVLGTGTGVASWAQMLVVPAMDGIYLMDGVSTPVLLSRPIEPLYDEYVAAGFIPGRAVVYGGFYLLPIIDTGGQWIDTLACQLSHSSVAPDSEGSSFAWSHIQGQGAKMVGFASDAAGTGVLSGGFKYAGTVANDAAAGTVAWTNVTNAQGATNNLAADALGLGDFAGDVSPGPNSPDVVANDASVGNTAWSSPTNAVSSNDSRATVTISPSTVLDTGFDVPGDGDTVDTGGVFWVTPDNIAGAGTAHPNEVLAPFELTDRLQGTSHGFSIPSDAIILGITLQIRRTPNGTACRDNEVKLRKAAGVVGSNRADTSGNWSAGFQTKTYGNALDTWGTTWTPAEINSSGFGAVFKVVGTDPVWAFPEVDWFQIKVSYLTATDTAQYLKATDYDFAVPSNATIQGITAEVERSASVGGVITDQSVRIVKGGSITGDSRASGSTWPTSDAYQTYGGSSDLWGESWTPADINSTGFGLAVVPQTTSSAQARVDHIRMTVRYTTPSSMETTQYLKATNFGHSLPTGAVVRGISVTVSRGSGLFHPMTDEEVKLVKAGAIVGSNKAATSEGWPFFFGPPDKTYGGNNDLWGTTWTEANVEASNFGVVIRAEGTGDAFIDSIGTTIFYTLPGDESGVSPNLLGAELQSSSRIANCTEYVDADSDTAVDADGSEIPFEVITRDFSTGNTTKNLVRKFRVNYLLRDAGLGATPELDIHYSTDEPPQANNDGAGFAPLDTGAVSEGVEPYSSRVGKRARRIRFKISTTGKASRAALQWVEIFTRSSEATQK
jgi:hypothetical protein